MLHDLRILVTSASRKIPLIRAIQEAARRIDPKAQVIAGDLDPQAQAQYVADAFWTMPRTEDSNVKNLLGGCIAQGVSVIFPTRDAELPFWSHNRDRFAEAGIAVVVSSPDAIIRCLDKIAFADWCSAHGLPAIPAASKLDRLGSGPFVVKERFGAGSQKIGLNLDTIAARKHAALLLEPVFQPHISGPEISIDAWITKAGRVHGLVIRSRDIVLNGESHVTTTFRDHFIESQAYNLLNSLDLYGPVVMQGIMTDKGLSVIEVNPRFGGASTTSIAVGLDSLYWSIIGALRVDYHPPPFDRSPREVRQVRVPQDIILHDPHI